MDASAAKVSAGRRPGFETEVDVARELCALDAPIVPLAPGLPGKVHTQDGFRVSFWTYCPQPADVDMPPASIASALHALHGAYRQLSPALRRRLPSYRAELRSVAVLLRDAPRLHALPETDRQTLIRIFDHLEQRVPEPTGETEDVIHGSPHLHNVLLVDGQPRFIDFETTCTGPIEWDLAHLAPDAATHYGGAVDTALLETCRDLARVHAAAWCWADADRGDLREHAEAHLAYLKTAFGPLG